MHPINFDRFNLWQHSLNFIPKSMLAFFQNVKSSVILLLSFFFSFFFHVSNGINVPKTNKISTEINIKITFSLYQLTWHFYFVFEFNWHCLVSWDSHQCVWVCVCVPSELSYKWKKKTLRRIFFIHYELLFFVIHFFRKRKKKKCPF